jgi:hypothetical protein
MVKGDFYLHEKVRRLCRDINNRADDRERLQTLVGRLQETLRLESYETRAATRPPETDDPFDKIVVA